MLGLVAVGFYYGGLSAAKACKTREEALTVVEKSLRRWIVRLGFGWFSIAGLFLVTVSALSDLGSQPLRPIGQLVVLLPLLAETTNVALRGRSFFARHWMPASSKEAPPPTDAS